MSNNRGPSKGCHRCKGLKVKCDTNRPSCQRCQKAGHNCIYQHEFDRLHRNQNKLAEVSAVSKWRQRSDIQVAEVFPIGPAFSLYDKALDRFCYDFVTPFPGALRRLPTMMKETVSNSCLNMAVAAVAYANFHGRCKSLGAKEASQVHYGKTLQRLALAMTDPRESQRDEFLMVIFLLGLYEIFTSSKRDGFWMTHMNGTQSVIAYRDCDSLKDGDHYLAILCMHLLVYHLSECKAPPAHLDHWIAQIPFEFTSKKRLATLMSKTAAICHQLRQRCNLPTTISAELAEVDIELLQIALAVDLQLESWTQELLPAWIYYRRHTINGHNRPAWSSALLNSPGAPDQMYIYSNPPAACDWNTCRSTRIRLHLAILDFLPSCPSRLIDVSNVKAQSTDWLLRLTGEIAQTIPYLLNLSVNGSSDPVSSDLIPGLRAYVTLWPAFTSFSCFLHKQMKDYQYHGVWFKTILRFLRDTAGIAKADLFLKEESSSPDQL